MYKVSWLSLILPALLGWTLLLVFVTGPVSEYFQELTELLLTTFSLVLDDFEVDRGPLMRFRSCAGDRLVQGDLEDRGPITYYKPEWR